MVFGGIVLTIFGTGMAISNLRNIIKDKETGKDEGTFDRGFIVSGIGFVITGIWLIAYSFIG